MKSVLFVCLANICRSPAAETIFKKIAEADGKQLHIESCGLGDWHTGHQADGRMQEAALLRGYRIVTIAKQFDLKYFDEFDYIIAVDHEVLRDLYRLSQSPMHKAKVHLLTQFSGSYHDQDIPDPYYSGDSGFELVLDMLEESCQGLYLFISGS